MKAKVWMQRLVGLVLLAISAAIIITTADGTTMADRDATGVLLTAPVGVLLVLSKKPIYD